MEKNDISVLRDILIALFILGAVTAACDNWSAISSFANLGAEKWSAFGTVVQAIGTVLQAYIAYTLYLLTQKQIQISEVTLNETKQSTLNAMETLRIERQAMILAQRPWLKVKIDKTKSNSIRWHGDSMLANFWFSVSNIGHSPAINVTLYYKLEIKHFGGNAQQGHHVWDHERQKKFAQNPAISTFDPTYPSYTIFPDDSETVYQMGGVADKDDRRIANVMSHLKRIGAEPSDRFAGFTMIGVVFYQFQPDGERYQTGIIFELNVVDSVRNGRNVENADFSVNDFMIGRPSVT